MMENLVRTDERGIKGEPVGCGIIACAEFKQDYGRVGGGKGNGYKNRSLIHKSNCCPC